MSNRKLIVEVIVDPKQAERGFTQTSRSAKVFERDLGHATRGALAGSGVFRGLGRSLAFASGGFLAFASAGDFIRKSIDAAKEAQVTQAQLSQQLKNGGKNFADYRDEIDHTNLALSSLSGFTKDELDASLTTILRTTGNVSKALRDNALAADIARARHISLAAAATIVAKTEAGNTTLLRRQGIQIAKNATVEQALAAAHRATAGQARAGTTEQERFGAVLHDTEEIVGNGLLPSLNKLLVTGTKWLQQMNETGRLQTDVARATKLAERVFNDFRAVVRGVDKVTGSFKNTIELLVALKIGASLSGMARGIGLIGDDSFKAGLKTDGLRASLLKLRGLGPIGVVIALSFVPKSSHGQKALNNAGVGGLGGLPVIGGLFTQGAALGDDINGLLGRPTTKSTSAQFGSEAKIEAQIAKLNAHPKQNAGEIKALFALIKKMDEVANGSKTQGQISDPTGKFSSVVRAAQKGLTASQRNRFFDSALTRSLDRVQDLGLNQQVGRLQQISASITKRIAATKDITRKLNLEDQLVGVNRQIKGVRSQIAQNVSDRVQSQQAALAEKIAKAKEAAAAAAAARAARNQSAQFKALGLSATGNQIIPVRVLKAQLGRLTDQVSGTLLDTTKTKSLFANIRKIFAGGFGSLTTETKSQIKQMLDGIDQQLKQHKSTQTAFKHLSSTAFAASISGLSAAQARQVRAAFAQVGAGGTVPGTRSLAFGAAGASNQVIQLNVDGVPMARVVTRHQQRADKRKPTSRRGTYAGHH